MRKHRAFIILLIFAAALLLSDIWSYKEFVRAESYFALGARLMVERNEWLAPHAPDESQLNKPPLSYWLIGISYKLFGTNYGSARLPSVLAALGVLVIVYWVAVWMNGSQLGLISGGMLASSYLFMTFARTAMSDMLLTLFVTIAFACFILTLCEPKFSSSRLVLLGYVSLALGVLTKGPVVLVLVAVPIAVGIMWSRDRGRIKHLRLARGLALFLTIAAPYFVVVYLRLGAEPLRFFFIGENLQRFSGQVYGSSGRPFWYEVVAFFADFAPWSVLIPVAAWVDWCQRKDEPTRSRTTSFLYLWLVSAIVLFSLSSFKLDYYLLPAMPAAALIGGHMIANADKLPRVTQRMLNAALLLFAVFILVAAFISLKAAAVLSVGTIFRFAPSVVAASGLAVVVLQIKRRRTPYAAITVMATVWATILTMQIVLAPAFAHYLPATRLAAAGASDRVWFTSWAASDWANCVAFNIAPPHYVERLTGDKDNQNLLAALKNNSHAVAVIWEGEYRDLVAREPRIQVLAQAETYGHGGLTLQLLRKPERARLLLVGRSP